MRCYPKTVSGGRVPVVLGGNSDAALDRVAACGDGWYGFNLSADEAVDRLQGLASRCRAVGRDPGSLDVSVAIRNGSPADLAGLEAAGAGELVIVDAPPEEARDAAGWVAELADCWSVSPTAAG